MSATMQSVRTTAKTSFSSRSFSNPSSERRSVSVHRSYGGLSGKLGAAVSGFRAVETTHSRLYGGEMEVSHRVGMGAGSRPYVSVPVTAVTVNKSLLTPVNVDVDAEFQAVKIQEKEQIKTLNNRFASFIDKVRFLEQQNKMLETKWTLLQEKTTSQSMINSMFETYIGNLGRQLESLGNHKLRLETDLNGMKLLVEEMKLKYDDEINKRQESENDFVLIKKDTDQAFITKIELEMSLINLTDELEFLKQIYDEELRELLIQLKDTSVVVEMDNSRNLDVDAIIAEVRAQYEEMSKRSRAEVESWYKQKYEEMQVTVTQYGEDMRSSKAEIAEYNRKIQRMQLELGSFKDMRTNQETQVKEAEERGEAAVKEARLRIQELEEALQQAKRDMTLQVREYQSLMNIKLALDIEIATYRKLLEGEESRLERGIHSISFSRQTSSTSQALLHDNGIF